jgi:hypothetical protein
LIWPQIGRIKGEGDFHGASVPLFLGVRGQSAILPMDSPGIEVRPV